MSRLVQRESEKLEFKTSFNEGVIETLTAFANTKGGRVLIGVANNGTPVKIFAIGEESVQQWLNEIKNKTQPAIIPNAEVIKYKNGEAVAFTVQEFPVKPIAFRGRYFKRVKNSNHQLTPVEIFDNHISFFNPGGLYGDLSIDDLKTDTYSAYARNKLISEAFYLTGDIERYGSGFLRIREAISQYPTMKIDFQETCNGFMAIVSYAEQKISTNETREGDEAEDITEKGTEKGTEKVPEKITANQLSILENIERNQNITIQELSAIVGISESKIKENLSKLKSKGLIERIGADRGGYWQILKK